MRLNGGALRQTTAEILDAAGVDAIQAASVSDNLSWCDRTGRRNHGVERLPILIERVERDAIKTPCMPRFATLSASVHRLEADNGFGHHAGRLAMHRACSLAADHGIGVVGVTDSNFFGAAAYYVDLAAQEGMVSLALSNSFPKVAAAGGLAACLGTNPFAFGAPRREGRTLMVDMSTAAAAGSTLREMKEKGQALPEGIAIDGDGAPVRDPGALAGATLLPAAGAKGFGLALMVEVLGAVMTGAAIGPEVGSMYKDFSKGGRNGQLFMVLDPTRWMDMDAFLSRMAGLEAIVMASAPENTVRLPGDARWTEMARSDAEGVWLEPATAASFMALADKFDVKRPAIAGGCAVS